MQDRKVLSFSERLRERREQVQREKEPMQNAGAAFREQLAAFRVPAAVFARIGSVNRFDPKVNWTCPVCGPQPPLACEQGYIRRECACERELRYQDQLQAYVKQEKEREDEAQRKKSAIEAASNACYTWLGDDYSDDGLDGLTFENFHAYTPQLMMQKKQIQGLADDLPNTLILHGPYGCGKTHLACAILNQWREQGKPGLFTTGMNFFNALLACGDDMQAKQRIMARTYTTPLLVLDDPDHASSTEYRQSIYKEMFTKRCGRGLPTILTTNVAIKDNENAMALQHIIGGAAADRLNKGLVLVGIRATSYRSRQVK